MTVEEGPQESDLRDTASLVGACISRAEWIYHGDTGWSEAEVKLYLEDGRVVTFSAWGHSWFGPTIDIESP